MVYTSTPYRFRGIDSSSLSTFVLRILYYQHTSSQVHEQLPACCSPSYLHHLSWLCAHELSRDYQETWKQSVAGKLKNCFLDYNRKRRYQRVTSCQDKDESRSVDIRSFPNPESHLRYAVALVLRPFLKVGRCFLCSEKGEIHPHISPKTFLKLLWWKNVWLNG